MVGAQLIFHEGRKEELRFRGHGWHDRHRQLCEKTNLEPLGTEDKIIFLDTAQEVDGKETCS